MSTARRRLLLAGLAAGVLAAGSPPVVAEVSVDRLATGEVVPFLEPAPEGPWKRVRPETAPEDLLNGLGDSNGDGWPVVYANAGNARPEAVWASGGENREIRHAFHDGVAWSTCANLSHSTGADQLPVVDTDGAANVFVAWENVRNDRHSVHFTALSGADYRKLDNTELTGGNARGRRPSLAAHDDDFVYVAYEERRNVSDGFVRVAVERIEVPRDPVTHVVDGGEIPVDLARSVEVATHQAGSDASLEILVHSEDGSLWVDWIDEPGVVGWIEHLGGDSWSAVEYVGFDPAVGDDGARSTVRDTVLGS